MRSLLALSVSCVLAAAGCERARAEVRSAPAAAVGERGAPAGAASVQPAQAAGSELTDAAAAGADEAWVEALRIGDYREAARLLDARSDVAENPLLRYARARAAAELGEPARVLSLLEGLEAAIPALAPNIERSRAEAQLAEGPYAAAATFFAARGDVDSLSRAALAHERGGELAKASALAARVVAELKGKRRRSVEAMARDVRARAAVKAGAKAQAVADLRWLALEHPLGSEDADARLAKLAPERALTKEERLARALAFGRAGSLERAEAELTALAKAPGPAVAPARIERARGFAFYFARTDYRRANQLFARAAQGPGTDPAESLFYAARSLARAEDDAGAVSGYQHLRARHPRSRFAEQALYLIARTHYAGGRFAEAVAAYDAYLAQYGAKGPSRSEAAYERAVALLALGRHAPAARALAPLARSEKDPRHAARLRHLEGVARAGAGERAAATALFRRVAAEHPIGFFALASAERLRRLGEPVPLPLPPAPAAAALPALAIELPEAVRVLGELGLARDAELALAREETAFGARFGARAGEALCAAYGSLGVASRRYQLAQTHVPARSLGFAPTPATRWQWECIYPRPYARGVTESARSSNLPEALLYGVMRQESAFRADVRSSADARGLMQLLPTTAERIAAETGEPYEAARVWEPHLNVRLGARYLKKLVDVFGGNVPLAVASYNAGPVAVRRWLANAPALPLDLFVARIPYGETLEYVDRVVGNYARYRYLQAGSEGVPQLTLELPAVPPEQGLY